MKARRKESNQWRDEGKEIMNEWSKEMDKMKEKKVMNEKRKKREEWMN